LFSSGSNRLPPKSGNLLVKEGLYRAKVAKGYSQNATLQPGQLFCMPMWCFAYTLYAN